MLYKYYSATGSHRYLGTSSTPPSGYNYTPVGCFWKPTATASNKIPVYSYSFTQGADKDSRYASTSTTPSSPWVNDNTIIGYTFGQKLVQLKSCTEASGRYYFATEIDCPSGTTFSHISSLVYTYPCIVTGQYPIRAVINGAVRRATVDQSHAATNPLSLPGGFVNEYIIGCGWDGLDQERIYPNSYYLEEVFWNNGNVVLSHLLDIDQPPANVPEPPSGGISTQGLLYTPSRYLSAIHECYDSANSRHLFTADVTCPASTTYVDTIGHGFYPPCLAGETAVNSYVSGSGLRRLATSTPSGYSFEKLVYCISASWGDPVIELYKSSTSDYKYTTSDTYQRVGGLNGYLFNAQLSFRIVPRMYGALLSCWNPTTSRRVYEPTACPSGYLSEDYRYATWTAYDSEFGLVRMNKFYNIAEQDDHYVTDGSSPPSGYTIADVPNGWLKEAQELGTYPVYQFRKTGVAGGSDTFLRINNTYIPPGYTQVGGPLGFAFNAPSTGCNPIFNPNCFNKIRACAVSGSSMRGYFLNVVSCPGALVDEGIRFTSIPTSNYQAVIGGPNLVPYCQYQKSTPESDQIIIKCSDPVPSGYGANTYTNAPVNVGLMSPTAFSGLVPVYRYYRATGSDWDSMYSTDGNISGYTTKTLVFYALATSY